MSAYADERIVATSAELVDAIRDMSTNKNVRLITLREGVYDLSTLTPMSASAFLDLSMNDFSGSPVIQGDLSVTRDKIVLDAKSAGRILNVAFGDAEYQVLKFRNLTFRNGKADQLGSGGAICTSRWGKMVVTNCAFFSNSAMNSGGAVGGTLAAQYYYDCQFETNKIVSGAGTGGAVASCRELYKCIFRRNTCEGSTQAGAAKCEGSVTACVFDSNAVPGNWGYYGGGALQMLGSGTIDGCTFTSNSVTGSLQGNGGGGAIVSAGFTGQIVNSDFFGNSVGSSKHGGAIYGGGASVVISNCHFRGNTATANWTSRGGAVAECGARIVECTFEENSASYGGGIWHCTNVWNCVFTKNRSTYNDGNNGGGAGYESSFYGCVITNNSSVYQCGGVYACKVRDSYVADNWGSNVGAVQEAGAAHFEGCTLEGRADKACRAMFFRSCGFNRSTVKAFDTQFFLGTTAAATNCVFTDIKATGLFSIGSALGAALVNCTFAENDYAQLFRWEPSCESSARAVAVNVLCWNNMNRAGGNVRRDDLGTTESSRETFTNCCFSTAQAFAGAGNLNYHGNPTLAAQVRLMGTSRDPEHPFSPRLSSVVNGAGVVQEWMTGAFDLAGHARLTEGKVAIGAFETEDRQQGFVIGLH